MALEGKWAIFTKFVFVFFNFLFLIIGLAALGFGVWGRFAGTSVFEESWFPKIEDEELRRHISSAFIWLIVGSVVIIGIAFLGFCGGWKENQCLLFVFFLLVFIITLVFLAAIVLFFKYPETLSDGLKEVLKLEKKKYLEKRKSEPGDKDVKNVDQMQTTLHCCLWNETEAKDLDIKSCFGNGTASNSTASSTAFHSARCSDELLARIRDVIDAKKLYFVLIVVVAVLVCIGAMALSLYLCRKIRQKDNYEEMKS